MRTHGWVFRRLLRGEGETFNRCVRVSKGTEGGDDTGGFRGRRAPGGAFGGKGREGKGREGGGREGEGGPNERGGGKALLQRQRGAFDLSLGGEGGNREGGGGERERERERGRGGKGVEEKGAFTLWYTSKKCSARTG